MAITVEGGYSLEWASSGSPSDFPQSALDTGFTHADDDVLYAFIACDQGTGTLSIADDGGGSSGGTWVELDSFTDSATRGTGAKVYRKIVTNATNEDAQTYEVNNAGDTNEEGLVMIVQLRGVDTTTPEDGVTVTITRESDHGTTPTPTGITGASSDSLALIFIHTNGNDVTAYTQPSGYTKVPNTEDVAIVHVKHSAAYKQLSATSETPGDWTTTGGRSFDDSQMVTIAVRTAAASGTDVSASTIDTALDVGAATGSISQSVSAGVIDTALDIGAATVSSTIPVSASTITTALDVGGAGVQVDVSINATTIDTALGVEAASGSVSVSASATTIDTALGVEAATGSTGIVATPSTIETALDVGAATVSVSVSASVTTIDTALDVGAAVGDVGTNASASPTTIDTAIDVGAASGSVSVSVSATVIDTALDVGAASASISISVSAATIDTALDVGAAVASADISAPANTIDTPLDVGAASSNTRYFKITLPSQGIPDPSNGLTVAVTVKLWATGSLPDVVWAEGQDIDDCIAIMWDPTTLSAYARYAGSSATVESASIVVDTDTWVTLILTLNGLGGLDMEVPGYGSDRDVSISAAGTVNHAAPWLFQRTTSESPAVDDRFGALVQAERTLTLTERNELDSYLVGARS